MVKKIKVSDLAKGFFMFGNKGSVWNNSAHIAKNNDPVTLCNVPMLSTNWAHIENLQEIGCEKCIKKYIELTIK